MNREWAFGSWNGFCLLVNSNVVDEHFVRELGVVYFKAWPVAGNGNVQ